MKKDKEFEFYEKRKDWDFKDFQIISEKLTDWDMYEILKEITDENSKVLDLGTGGGEKVIRSFPKYLKEVIATDYSPEMIKTAERNLEIAKLKNIKFMIMDNLNMTLPKDYFDVVTARNTITDPKQIYDVLKENGHLLIRGVDMYDCYELKRIFEKGQGFNDDRPISIKDYEAVLDAGFREVELVPLHQREYFKNKEVLKNFLEQVPILKDEFDETEINDDLLEEYVSKNTYPKGVRLLRRYYGICAKK